MTARQLIPWSECIDRLGRALLHRLWQLALMGLPAVVFPSTFAKTQAQMPGPGARMAAVNVMAALTLPNAQPGLGTQPPFEAVSRDRRPYLKYYGAAGTGLRAGFVPAKALPQRVHKVDHLPSRFGNLILRYRQVVHFGFNQRLHSDLVAIDKLRQIELR